jgi:hypothetical protein
MEAAQCASILRWRKVTYCNKKCWKLSSVPLLVTYCNKKCWKQPSVPLSFGEEKLPTAIKSAESSPVCLYTWMKKSYHTYCKKKCWKAAQCASIFGRAYFRYIDGCTGRRKSCIFCAIFNQIIKLYTSFYFMTKELILAKQLKVLHSAHRGFGKSLAYKLF